MRRHWRVAAVAILAFAFGLEALPLHVHLILPSDTIADSACEGENSADSHLHVADFHTVDTCGLAMLFGGVDLSSPGAEVSSLAVARVTTSDELLSVESRLDRSHPARGPPRSV